MMRRGDVCIWSKKQPDGSVSRILCTISNRTPKNIEITRWVPKVQRFVKVWASPKSLAPATEPEKRQFERLLHEWQQVREAATTA